MIDDNKWNQVKRFIRSIEDFGFEKVMEVLFNDYDTPDIHEHMYVFFYRKYGIILQFETITYSDIIDITNGNYYYQWKASDTWLNSHIDNPHHPCLSSGGYAHIGEPYSWHFNFWHGSSNKLYSMMGHINQLAKNGEFLTPWFSSGSCMDHPTFVNRGDHQTDPNLGWDVGYKAYTDALKIITPKRFAVLPDYVKRAIRNGCDEYLLD